MSLSRIRLPATPTCAREVNKFMASFEEAEKQRNWLNSFVICTIFYHDGDRYSTVNRRIDLIRFLSTMSVEVMTMQ